MPYDFLLDDGDTFSISRPRGVLPSASTAHVTVIFRCAYLKITTCTRQSRIIQIAFMGRSRVFEKRVYITSGGTAANPGDPGVLECRGGNYITDPCTVLGRNTGCDALSPNLGVPRSIDVRIFVQDDLDQMASGNNPCCDFQCPSASSSDVAFRRSTAPKNHWRRVVCLLKDADPLSVDLLATSYDDKARPPPLSHRHITNYLTRVTSGGPPVDDLIMSTHVAPSVEVSGVTVTGSVATTAQHVHMDGELPMGPSEVEFPSALSLIGVEAAVVDTSGAHTLLPGGQWVA